MIKRVRLSVAGLGAAALAGCVPQVSRAPAPAVSQAPVTYSTAGLTEVLGSTAAQLVARFGQPDLDVHEGTARKLQFVSPACVLDAYLYPRGAGEPAVTHIDARLPDGRDMDRASCVAALSAARQRR